MSAWFVCKAAATLMSAAANQLKPMNIFNIKYNDAVINLFFKYMNQQNDYHF